MTINVTTELGKTTDYSKKYSPDILIAIPRKNSDIPSFGHDVWRAYELSWVDENYLPQVATIVIAYKASSSFIVESKSLKLYLGSFNFMMFITPYEVLNIIARDLSFKLGTKVEVYFDHAMTRSKLLGVCIDQTTVKLDIKDEPNKYDLKTTHEKVTDYKLHSNLFRSCCPVTNQPDWASIFIQYSGNKIDEEELLCYLISYRNHQSFHEECVNTIYSDIYKQCKPNALEVKGFFTRRGGIDINPIRTSQEKPFDNIYLARQ